jgi:hypothetical protein
VPAETKPLPVAERKAPESPADLVRGGAQHKAIQHRIKQAAEQLGFRSTIEKQIPGGSVDLLLERVDRTFACEISITTTIDHEVGNVEKCLKEGFSTVAVICAEDARLKRIAAAVAGGLGSELAARVIYCQPDEFIARTVTKLTPEEQKQREEGAIWALAEAMRKKDK